MKRFTKGRLAAAGVILAALSIMLFGTVTASNHTGSGTATLTIAGIELTVTDNAAVIAKFRPAKTFSTEDTGGTDFLLTNTGLITYTEITINATTSAPELVCDAGNNLTIVAYDDSGDFGPFGSGGGTDQVMARADVDNDFSSGAVNIATSGATSNLGLTTLAAGTEDVDIEVSLASTINAVGGDCTFALTFTAS